MKKILIYIAFLLVPAMAWAMGDGASKDVVYLFGVSYSYSDSVAYFTEVQPLEGIKLQKRSKVLPDRQHYAYELKDYMNFKEGMPGRISMIYFSKKRSKLEKVEAKVKRRLLHKENKTVLYLGDKFKFTRP